MGLKEVKESAHSTKKEPQRVLSVEVVPPTNINKVNVIAVEASLAFF